MIKSNITICIDSDVRVELKARRVNVSELVNRLLRQSMSMELKENEKEDLAIQMEKKNMELAEIKSKMALIEAHKDGAKERYEAWKAKNVQLGSFTSFQEFKEVYDK